MNDAAFAGQEPARILVVEDHGVVREGFVALINREPDLVVSAEAENPSTAMESLCRDVPDLMIVDLVLQGGDGIHFIKESRALYPDLAILVVSMQDEEIYAERALRAGAKGYIMKEHATDRFLDAIRSVLAGDIFLSRKMTVRLLSKVLDGGETGGTSRVDVLTDRELQVFQMIGSGMATREIAATLGISGKTVESYRENIKNKLTLKDGAALTREATQWVESARQ